jgi:hypothetical protein
MMSGAQLLDGRGVATELNETGAHLANGEG